MSFTHQTALSWFRRDLRLANNPALAYALYEAALTAYSQIKKDANS